MELFGFHVPGTRDKDAEIAELSERLRTLRESEAHQLNNFHRRLNEKDRCIEAGIREQLLLRKERDTVLEELRELQSKAPYQVRDENGILMSAHMDLGEAVGKVFHAEETLSVWKRENGKHREMAFEEIHQAATAMNREEGQGLRPLANHPVSHEVMIVDPAEDGSLRGHDGQTASKPTRNAPQKRGRQPQPQTPPPHVLYRPPGPSRGMER